MESELKGAMASMAEKMGGSWPDDGADLVYAAIRRIDKLEERLKGVFLNGVDRALKGSIHPGALLIKDGAVGIVRGGKGESRAGGFYLQILEWNESWNAPSSWLDMDPDWQEWSHAEAGHKVRLEGCICGRPISPSERLCGECIERGL